MSKTVSGKAAAGKALSETAIAQYHDQGFYSPVDVLGTEEAAACRARLEAFEATQGGRLEQTQRNKAHLLFKWVDDLVRDPRVLDPIADLIGPDILCWNTLFWIKEANSPTFVSWHQDSHYWGLAGGEVVSAWIALSPASETAGCMRVLPGSHAAEALAHEDRYHDDNMLTRGQEVAETIDESRAVAMPLEPGQMSLHSTRTAHASGANRSADRRIGLSLHFMPPQTRQIVSDWDSAALVRGQDRYGHFEHTPRLTGDFDATTLAFHGRASRAVRDILYHGAELRTGRL